MSFCYVVVLLFLLLCVLFRLWFLWPDDTLKNKRCKNKCGCLGGCRFFGGTVTGLDFFKLEELTPSSSSAFSSTSAESDMYYGQSLLQPGEWIITKEVPKIVDGSVLSHVYLLLSSFLCHSERSSVLLCSDWFFEQASVGFSYNLSLFCRWFNDSHIRPSEFFRVA